MEEVKHIYDLPKPIIFTHGDVDGLCAAALLIREFMAREIEVEVVITQPFSLHNDILKYDESYNVIILDLAMTNKTKEVIFPGTIIIDHHPATADFYDMLKSLGMFVVYDLKKSASQLVYNIVKRDKTSRYISKLGAAGDWIIHNDELGRQSTLLASAMSWIPDDDMMRYYILGNLVIGNNVWQMEEVEKRSKMAFKKLDEIQEEFVVLYDDKVFTVYYYERGFGFASILANKIHRKTNKVAFVMCPLDDKCTDILVTARASNSVNIDLRKIFRKLYDLGGYGSGHAKAASGILPETNFFKFRRFLAATEKKILKGDRL